MFASGMDSLERIVSGNDKVICSAQVDRELALPTCHGDWLEFQQSTQPWLPQASLHLLYCTSSWPIHDLLDQPEVFQGIYDFSTAPSS